MPMDQTDLGSRGEALGKEGLGKEKSLQEPCTLLSASLYKVSNGHAGIEREAGKMWENFYVLYNGSSRSIGMGKPDLWLDTETIHEPFELFWRELPGFG